MWDLFSNFGIVEVSLNLYLGRQSTQHSAEVYVYREDGVDERGHHSRGMHAQLPLGGAQHADFLHLANHMILEISKPLFASIKFNQSLLKKILHLSQWLRTLSVLRELPLEFTRKLVFEGLHLLCCWFLIQFIPILNPPKMSQSYEIWWEFALLVILIFPEKAMIPNLYEPLA